jgi:hypothetical protein
MLLYLASEEVSILKNMRKYGCVIDLEDERDW